jgi:8-oxo-dGTP pyrophosphatase MutT (NUDIX family)
MATAGQARREYPSSDADRETLLRDSVALIAYLRPRLTPPPFETLATASALNGTSSSESVIDEAPVTARQAAVLAALYSRAGAPWLIFTQRATGLPRHSGEISFPGGRRDATDPTLAHTALRETHEELALDAGRVSLLGSLPGVFASVSSFAVTTYVGWLGEGKPEMTPAPGEVAEVIEAPLLALDDPTIFHQEIWTRGGLSHPVVFYDFGRHRIWGLTGHLLHELLGLLPPRQEL